MNPNLKNILKNEKPVKDFSSLNLSYEDLVFLKDELINYTDVHFINWNTDNADFWNTHSDSKNEIQAQLLKNMLAHADNELVIDLSQCEFDEKFLDDFLKAIEDNSTLSKLIFNDADQEKYKDNEIYQKIIEKLKINIENYRRFPSEYVHALLVCHCNNDKDNDLVETIKDMGWEIEQILGNEENESTNYVSILYKNRSKKQLVLAFKGQLLYYSHLKNI